MSIFNHGPIACGIATTTDIIKFRGGRIIFKDSSEANGRGIHIIVLVICLALIRVLLSWPQLHEICQSFVMVHFPKKISK